MTALSCDGDPVEAPVDPRIRSIMARIAICEKMLERTSMRPHRTTGELLLVHLQGELKARLIELGMGGRAETTLFAPGCALGCAPGCSLEISTRSR
jgi:hypothetical protein